VFRAEVGLDELPTGFTDTPRQVIEASVGTWTGLWQPAGEPGEAALVLVDDTTVVYRVEEEYVAPSGDDDAMGGDVELSCETHYEIALTATLTAPDAGLAEAFGVTLDSDANGRRGFAVHLSVDQVSEGAARPTQWDASELYSELVIEGTFQDDVLGGSVSWVTTGEVEPATEQYELEQYAIGEELGEFVLERE
jgi:hypothetical protein